MADDQVTEETRGLQVLSISDGSFLLCVFLVGLLAHRPNVYCNDGGLHIEHVPIFSSCVVPPGCK